MPEMIKSLYDEAAMIVQHSPRGAAALLRLALQTFLKETLNCKGKNINDDIQQLINDQILSQRVTKAMESMRIIGNNVVHPGEINFEDNCDIAMKLFDWLNYIVKETITEPKELNALLKELPAEDQKRIEEKHKTPLAK
jgi:hypothetical protein